MITLRKRGGNFDTIRAEELQIGDRFMFDGRHIKVVSATNYKGETIILMQGLHFGFFSAIDAVTFPYEMFITIVRR